jgi:hypothetical protein
MGQKWCLWYVSIESGHRHPSHSQVAIDVYGGYVNFSNILEGRTTKSFIMSDLREGASPSILLSADVSNLWKDSITKYFHFYNFVKFC